MMLALCMLLLVLPQQGSASVWVRPEATADDGSLQRTRKEITLPEQGPKNLTVERKDVGCVAPAAQCGSNARFLRLPQYMMARKPTLTEEEEEEQKENKKGTNGDDQERNWELVWTLPIVLDCPVRAPSVAFELVLGEQSYLKACSVEARARISFWRLIEYIEQPGGDDGYEPGIDWEVNSWPLLSQPVSDQCTGVQCLLSPLGNNAFVQINISLPKTAKLPKHPNAAAISVAINRTGHPAYPQSRVALKVAFNSLGIPRQFSTGSYDETQAIADGNSAGIHLGDSFTGQRTLFVWQDARGDSCGRVPVVFGKVYVNEPTPVEDFILEDDPMRMRELMNLQPYVSYFSFIPPRDCGPENMTWTSNFGVSLDSNPASRGIVPLILISLLASLSVSTAFVNFLSFS